LFSTFRVSPLYLFGFFSTSFKIAILEGQRYAKNLKTDKMSGFRKDLTYLY